MRTQTAFALSLAVVVAACAGPAEVQRAESPRAAPVAVRIDDARPQQPLDESATQKWLAGEVAAQRQKDAQVEQPRSDEQVVSNRDRGLQSRTDEEATKAWLRQTIEERRVIEEQNLPPPPPVVETRTVYVDRYSPTYGYGYDAYGNPMYVSDPYYRSYRGTSFPYYTVTGATIGAFANGCRSNGRDIAIGAGIGFLFDVGSSCWW